MKSRPTALLNYWLMFYCLLAANGCALAFETDFWPGEGVPHVAALGEHIVLHEAPSSESSKLAPYPTDPASEIPYAESRVLTVSPGLVEANTPSTLTGRNFGSIKRLTEERYYESTDQWLELAIGNGDEIEHLQDRAGGTCFARIRSEVYELEQCPWRGTEDATNFSVSGPPVTQWWIQVLNPAGQAVGWLLVDAKQTKQLPRSF